MDAVEKLLELARSERKDLWDKLTYRSEDHKPTLIEVTKWVERIKELTIVIEFFKENMK